MCELIASAPVRPSVSQEMHQLFLAKGVLATTAIEGNTLSEKQVRDQIDGKLNMPPSKAYLQQEIQNIIGACNTILDQIQRDEVPRFNAALIQKFNRLVLQGLDTLEEGVVPGEISQHDVVFGSVYRGVPREDCTYLLEQMTKWLNGFSEQMWADWEHPSNTPMAIVKAVLAHLYIAWIHPFGDGNGRTARLVEFSLLVGAGVPFPAAHLLSNHYNETRSEYYRQLDRASKSGGKVFPFLQYAVEGLADGMRVQLELVRREQMQVAWQSYVFEVFRDMKRSAALSRQRDLVLDLSDHHEPVPKKRIPDLTPRLARNYATKSAKSVTRDVNALLDLELIRQTEDGLVANTGIILGFLPVR